MADEPLTDASLTSAMSTESTISDRSVDATLKDLKGKRRARRGNVTKVQNRLMTLQKKHPSTVSASAVDTITNDVKIAIQKLDEIQEQIDSLVPDPFTFTDPTDRDHHDKLHATLLADLEDLAISTLVHRQARLLTSVFLSINICPLRFARSSIAAYIYARRG